MPRVRRALPLALLLFAAPAHAFAVKTTSTGTPVHWAPGEVALALTFDPMPDDLEPARAAAATQAALATWQAALDGTGVTLTATTVTAGTDHADHVNSIRWATAAADPDIEDGVLALTFLAYQTSDGAIVDADIVMNAADFTWTTDPTGCTSRYDVAAAMTHELGHLLGLGHAIGHPEATMFATGEECEIGKRDLAADDVDGIDDLYRTIAPAPPATCAAGDARASGGAALIVLAALGLRRRRRAAVLLGAALVVTGAPAQAAELRRLALVDLADRADLVIRGRVVASAPSADGPLATDSAVLVDECLAGACPIALVVRRRGGERDGLGLWVDGEAALAPGTEVVLYLRTDARGRLRVVGGVQGELRIERARGEPRAVRDLRAHRVRIADTWQAGDLESIDLAAVRRSVARPAAR